MSYAVPLYAAKLRVRLEDLAKYLLVDDCPGLLFFPLTPTAQEVAAWKQAIDKDVVHIHLHVS